MSRDYDQEIRSQLAAAWIVGDSRTIALMTLALEGRDKGARLEAEAVCRAKWRAEEVQ